MYGNTHIRIKTKKSIVFVNKKRFYIITISFDSASAKGISNLIK